MSEDQVERDHQNDHPKRRRWDGHVDRLPYETERFDGGEKARLTYRDFDGSQCAVQVEVGEYMSHNSWLLLFDDDGSGDEHIVRADGVVLLQTWPDEEISEVGHAQKIETIALPDGGEDHDSGTPRWLLKTWKELTILLAHTVPFIALFLAVSEVIGLYAIGFMATLYVAFDGGEWLMKRWYDSEVLFRDD